MNEEQIIKINKEQMAEFVKELKDFANDLKELRESMDKLEAKMK